MYGSAILLCSECKEILRDASSRLPVPDANGLVIRCTDYPWILLSTVKTKQYLCHSPIPILVNRTVGKVHNFVVKKNLMGEGRTNKLKNSNSRVL